MSGKAMAKRVRVDGRVEARTLSGSVTRMPNRFRVDRVIRRMPTVAGKEPVAGFSPQPAPVLAQFLEQLGAEHDIPVFAAFSSLDVNHHALAVDIADLQARQLGTPQASSVEGHQQSAMERSARRIDESRDFFLAEDGWEAVGL